MRQLGSSLLCLEMDRLGAQMSMGRQQPKRSSERRRQLWHACGRRSRHADSGRTQLNTSDGVNGSFTVQLAPELPFRSRPASQVERGAPCCLLPVNGGRKRGGQWDVRGRAEWSAPNVRSSRSRSGPSGSGSTTSAGYATGRCSISRSTASCETVTSSRLRLVTSLAVA